VETLQPVGDGQVGVALAISRELLDRLDLAADQRCRRRKVSSWASARTTSSSRR
jgi:hypothetical protein